MDDDKKQLFTISAFTENNVGVLNQVTMIFTRRCINIESISSGTTSIPGIYKITITAIATRHTIEKVVKQIEKRIDIIKAYFHSDDEIIYQEIALYKVPTTALLHESNLEAIIRHYNARILEITPEYTVLEKTGHIDETQALFEELKRFDIRQFVRSGRVAVTRHPVEFVSNYIETQAKLHPEE